MMNAKQYRAQRISDLDLLDAQLKATMQRGQGAREMASLARRIMDVQREKAKLLDDAEKERAAAKQAREAKRAEKAPPTTALDRMRDRRRTS